MSIKEVPYPCPDVDLFDKNLAYRKHMTVLANAKTVLNTTGPLPMRRLVYAQRGMSPQHRWLRHHFGRPKKSRPRLPANPPPEFWAYVTQDRSAPSASASEVPLFNRMHPKSRMAPASPMQAALGPESDDSDIPDPSDSSDAAEPLLETEELLVETEAATRWRGSTLPEPMGSEVIRIGYDRRSVEEESLFESMDDAIDHVSLSEHFRLSALSESSARRSVASASVRSSPARSPRAAAVPISPAPLAMSREPSLVYNDDDIPDPSDASDDDPFA
jgi:hypothetical protein